MLTAPVKDLYQATVWVFSNISGLITFLPDGSIHSINDNLARLLFGYRKKELIGMVCKCFSDRISAGFQNIHAENNTNFKTLM